MKRFGRLRRARLWLAGGLAVLVVAMLGGCGPIASTINTESALRSAGYQSVSVNFSVGNTDEVKVSVTVNAEPTLSNADDVAHVVWNKFHERFSVLAVTVHGSGPAVTRDYSYADLVTMFGPRNPAYDRTSLSSAATRLGVIVIIVLVVLVAAVVVVVVMVTRRRRRRRPTWPTGGPPWMQGGPPPPGGQPVWQGGPPPPPYASSSPPAWQGGPPPPPAPRGPQPPASYPMWPPPQGPPPGQGQAPAEGAPPTQEPNQSATPQGPPHPGSQPEPPPTWPPTTWPPAPSPPAGDDEGG